MTLDNRFKPKISIVIPSYNSGKYLKNTIGFALNQTIKDAEVIIVDDGSSDNTQDLVKQYIDNEKIVYFYQNNQGPAAARRTGLFKARGQYVAFWDADDEWCENFLEEMVNYLEKKEFDWVVCDNYAITLDAQGAISDKRLVTRPENIENSKNLYFEFLKNDFIGSPSKVLGKKACFLEAGIEREDLRIREDWALWIRMAKCNFKLGILSKPLCSYIMRGDNTNLTRRSGNRWIYDTYKLMTTYRDDYLKTEELKMIYADCMWDLSRKLFYAKENIPFAIKCAIASQLVVPSIKRIRKSFSNIWNDKGEAA